MRIASSRKLIKLELYSVLLWFSRAEFLKIDLYGSWTVDYDHCLQFGFTILKIGCFDKHHVLQILDPYEKRYLNKIVFKGDSIIQNGIPDNGQWE